MLQVKMKPLVFILLLFSVLSCSKHKEVDIVVTSMDQLQGEWQWVSTCGGIVQGCIYPSSGHFETIVFSRDGNYVEKHNDTVFQQSGYTVVNINETSGTLILDKEEYQSPLSIVNNSLEISFGELVRTYKKTHLPNAIPLKL